VSSLARSVASASLIALLVLSVSACAPQREPFPGETSATPTVPPVVETPTPTPTPTPTFDKTKNSIDDPASLWVVANKLRPLNPKDYAAPDLVAVPVPYVYAPSLRKKASDAVVAMFNAFNDETGLGMKSQSAYRSYSAQVSVYNNWVSSLGQAGADLTSARPGHSEHQTGLAIDISASDGKCALKACFADTPQGSWLAENAWKYGFILRYPNGETKTTGYEFEPWHYRYVGKALATEMHTTGITTMEEFFGLPDATDYAK